MFLRWASALSAVGNVKLSKTLHSFVLADREYSLGPNHEETLNSKTALASALRRLESYGFTEVLGAGHADVEAALEEFVLTLEN